MIYVYIASLVVGVFCINCSGANVDRTTIASGHLLESKDCQVALYADRNIEKFTACQDAVDARFGIGKDGGL